MRWKASDVIESGVTDASAVPRWGSRVVFRWLRNTVVTSGTMVTVAICGPIVDGNIVDIIDDHAPVRRGRIGSI